MDHLNQLLADTITLRDLYKKHHWQVAGPTFYQLHLLFDTHYEQQNELVDEIARSEVIETMHRTAAELKASGAEDVALTVGDRAPAFTLMNQDVVHVALGDLLRAGPLVVYESFGDALHRFHNEPSFRVG